MHKIRQIIYLFILCISISLKHYSQTIVATPSLGCSPLVGVQFTGLTGATSIQWAFGDGTFSNINNPTHTFSSPGNFVATYTAMVSGSPTTQTTSITVFGKPTPNFTLDIASGCVPLSVSFTDQSVNTGGSLTPQWQWSFGDGGVSSAQNPNYAFTLPGTFNVTLIYKDGHGCDSAITKTNLIKVSIKPTVVITSTPASLNACVAPFTATFSGSSSASNSTTGSTALTYNWNINGATSTSVNPPPVTFTTTGSFPVTFTCTDNNACSDSKTVTVNILNPTVKALVKNFVCYNKTFIVRDSSASTVTQWNFGDGTPVQSVFPPNTTNHVYASAGIFTITATTFLGSCSSVKTYTVNVEKATADFTSVPPFSCNSPLVVTYNNTSTGASTYSWTFSGSTVTSTLTSPTHTFTQGSLNPFTIFQPLPLSGTLIAISPGGCRDSITKTLDTLHRPTAFFYTDVIQGCNPLTVTFTDSSKSTHPIVNYTWNYGDGSPVNSSATNTLVTHTYTTPGVFYATLVIENTLGCKDTSFKWPIHVATPPHTNFSFSPTSVCPYEYVSITNLTPPADSVNHWHLTSDASYFSHCISDANPSWQYTHTGTHPLTLSAYSFGCQHDTTLPTPVLVKGPIVSGRYFTRCDSVFKVEFHLLLQDAAFAEIRYGDGERDTVYTAGSHIIYHTYAATGNYDAIIKGENTATGCLPSFDTLKVKVRNIKSAITSQSITCAGVPTTYAATASQDVDGVCGVGYIWFFGTQPPVITDNTTTSYALGAGTQSIVLVVKDENGCRDTSRTTIYVSYVTTNATLSNTIGCAPSFSLAGTQSTTSDTTITNYSWNFGDGSATVTTPNASHTYTTATPPSTNYNISLTVTNINGCSDTKNYPVTMSAPFPPNIIASPIQICAGKTVTLSTTTAGVTYTWNYGDGTPVQVTPSMNVTHQYLAGGNFSVTLSSEDGSGCKANSLPTLIQVQSYPTAIISYTNTSNPTKQNACAGSVVEFSDNSINPYLPQTRSWDFGDGSSVVGNDTVGTAYTTPGTYTVTLINCTPFGCCNTSTQTINVYSATADFGLDKLNICKGEAIKFTIKDTTNVFVWGWDFGDGTDYNLTPQSPISHNYNYHPPGGTTNVSLTYYSADSACRYSVVKSVNIYQVIANFNRNNELPPIVSLSDTAHCIGTTDMFSNVSLNANTAAWNFGDGTISSVNSPSHTYNSAGTYTVSLSITDNVHNCKDTLKKTMQIFPIPLLTLNGRDTCQNKSTQLQASGATNYTWSPSVELNNATVSNPVATLSATTLFSVTANDINGCVGTNTLLITIQEPPIPISWDTSIVIGQTTPLPGYAGAGFNYTWTPGDYLNCLTCVTPVASPTVEYIYSVKVTDAHGCFERINTYTVYIEPKSSLDVPTAFTPNGDGINDLINVDGWGIRKLKYFKVFNRWGELIYETTDLNSGWDGIYKGVPQNMETYIYQAEAETYTDTEPIKKTGYFKLLR